jgi:hypothetical protein
MQVTLCGAPIRLVCGTAYIESRVVGVFRKLFALSPASVKADSGADSGIEFRICDITEEPVTGEVVYDVPEICVIRTARGYYLRAGESFLSLDLDSGRADGSLSPEFLDAPLEQQRGLLLFAILMLLSGRGIYPLHAGGAVSPAGHGILLAGTSGSGKTTLTCALARSGWSYLSDDSVLLKATSAGVEAVAFGGPFHCAPAMFRHFPELCAQANPHESDKRLVEVEPLYPGRLCSRMQPKAILFPTIVPEFASRVIPLSKTETLVHLLRDGASRLHSRESMAAQMAALTQLVETARGYRLLHGADVHRHPQRVAALIEQLTRSEGDRNAFCFAA